jgi:hypothetical protein
MTTVFQLEDAGSGDPFFQGVRIRVRTDNALQQRGSSEATAQTFDPDSTGIQTVTLRARPYWTLDAMRRLSEAITRNRPGSK